MWFKVRNLSFSSEEEQIKTLQFFFQHLDEFDPQDLVWLIVLLKDHFYRLGPRARKDFFSIVKFFLRSIEEIRKEIDCEKFSLLLETLGIIIKMGEGKECVDIFETIWEYRDSTNSHIRENVLYIAERSLHFRQE